MVLVFENHPGNHTRNRKSGKELIPSRFSI